ncbi:MAG: carboxypeptidase regulatory-like domain-containing protein, partial [Thermoplasmatota archaeon]
NRMDISASSNLGTGVLRGLENRKGTLQEITVRVKRFEPMADRYWYHLFVKDGSGAPAPSQKVHVWVNHPKGGEVFNPISDENGRVDVFGPPGEYDVYIYDDIKHHRNFFATGRTTLKGVPGGGYLGDATVYPTTPLDPIDGFVRDIDTSEPIMNVYVSTNSVRKVETTRNGFSPGIDSVNLFYMYSGSREDGYYRTWGMEDVHLRFSRQDYFPREYHLEKGTRAQRSLDVYMERIPVYSTFINGTLVNEDDEPIDGMIYVYDRDREYYEVFDDYFTTGGNFSIPVYPGNFTLEFYNDTLNGTLELEVGPGGAHHVILRLVPMSFLRGTVVDWSGAPLEGYNVTLMDEGLGIEANWQLSGPDGNFSFRIPKGNYRVRIWRTELYDTYEGEVVSSNGWKDHIILVVMANRSQADIIGTVLGEGGPFASGIPGAFISLLQDGIEVENTTADETGSFGFKDIDHGKNYSMTAFPPDDLRPVEDLRSGYLENTTLNMTISGAAVVIDMHLPFIMIEPPGWLNITGYFPKGGNVSIDAPVVIRFSGAVDLDTVKSALVVEPSLNNISYSLTNKGRTMVVDHDPFAINTTYHVYLAGTVLSEEGWPLWDHEGISWNFTTGYTYSDWALFSADVMVGDDRETFIEAAGMSSLDVYIIVQGVGSYILLEVGPGEYAGSIPGEDLEWETVYSYHFSMTGDGPDMAPALAGTFTTPMEPVPTPGWELLEAEIELEGLKWIVEALGSTNLSVWIVIEDVGSFELSEVEDGIYQVTVPPENFQWDTLYYYHFSDREGGDDLAENLSGMLRTPKEPAGDDDDDDDDISDLFRDVGTYTALCCLIVVVLIIALIGLVIISRRSRGSEKDIEDMWEE